MVEEMITTVRAAFAPGADDATKDRAVRILRAAIGMLESGRVASETVPTGGAPAPAPPIAPGPDLLTTIVEYIRPHLPPEALAQMPHFRVPLPDLIRHNG